MANYFEITPSIRKLYKDFKTIFVFKFGPKTKKFTPKWQIPLFEKRVAWGPVEWVGDQLTGWGGSSK